jgi:hypothetical protein
MNGDPQVQESSQVEEASQGPETIAAPAPGTAVLGTATIASLFTLAYSTLSGDLGTPTYKWIDPFTIQANFVAGTTDNAKCSIINCRFEARALVPSTITP